jgi:hypothetical protein
MHGTYYKGQPKAGLGLTGGEDMLESHKGYISIPLYAHLYKTMKKCNFEFVIGPDFNLLILIGAVMILRLPFSRWVKRR